MKLISDCYKGKINFICANPDVYGAGHLFRCINLAYYLTDLGFVCEIFIKSADNAGLINSLKSKINFNFDISKMFESEWLVIDHYDFSMSNVTGNENCQKVIYFDDFCNSTSRPEIVLNYSPTVRISDYIINENQTLILGSDAAIVDGIFLEMRKLNVNKDITFPPKNILLNLGFAPSKELIILWINSLFDFFKDVFIEVNIGPNSNKDITFMQSLNQYKNKLKIHSFFENKIEFYLKFDIVFGNCGINSVERSVGNIPSINLLVADNQIQNFNFLKKRNALVFNAKDNINIKKIFSFLKTITLKKLETSSKFLFNLYDGDAPRRCALAMAGRNNFNKQRIWLRQVSIEDAFILYKWRLEKNTVISSRNPPPENFVFHTDWLKSKLMNQPLLFAIIMNGNVPVGSIRLEKIDFDKKSFEIFISISENHQNKKIAKTSLSILKKITPNIDIYANVLEDNKNSVKLFCNSSFIKFKKNWYKRG